MPEKPFGTSPGGPAPTPIVELPVDTRARSRDPDTVVRRIEARLAELRALCRARSLGEEPENPNVETGPAQDPLEALVARLNVSWQRRAKLRLDLVAWDGPAPAKAPIAFSAEQLDRLGRQFLAAAREGDFAAFMIFLEEGFPVNYWHPVTGTTALHVAAASRARRVVAALLATGRCDFLIRDEQGRLASERAYLGGRDPALARLLGTKERKQGQAQGTRVTRRPGRAPGA